MLLLVNITIFQLLLFQIEDEISTKYKNRRVNIMGEINTV